LINCTGPSSRYDLYGSVLLQHLFRSGYLHSDALSLGIDTLLNGTVLDAKQQANHYLFAIGPMTRGTLWEITAIPEIREQCAQLAQHLVTLQ
jgi:uncharacterized NAD(P)/FAD-binding protein YdhS